MTYLITSYRNLLVWQKAIELVSAVYRLSRNLPKEELYGLTSQLKRCAVSIPSNIAEGSRRGTRKDFRQFLLIAFSSGAELETQIEIAKRLEFVSNEDCSAVDSLLSEVMRMLNKLSASLNH